MELLTKKDPRKILWVGRMLAWKRPDDAIRAAAQLKKAGYVFSMDLVGEGQLEPHLRELIQELDLSDCVRLIGFMPPDEVRRHMERAGIFLFTSDRQEGWGAVLNEAMNSGCAVVAGSDAGATPCLVQNGVNGLVYPSGDIRALNDALKCLLDAPETAAELGLSACETITELWNGEVAARRLVLLTQAILEGNQHPDLYAEGPCSRAERLRKDWYLK